MSAKPFRTAATVALLGLLGLQTTFKALSNCPRAHSIIYVESIVEILRAKADALLLSNKDSLLRDVLGSCRQALFHNGLADIHIQCKHLITQ